MKIHLLLISNEYQLICFVSLSKNYIEFLSKCVKFLETFRESFLPWKKSPGKIRSKITQRYHNLEGTFFLIKVRPKKDIGLVEGTPIHYLTYFVQVGRRH